MKKLYLFMGVFILLLAGIVVIRELEELHREKGARRIRMLRAASGTGVKKEIPDLSSP